MSECSGSINSVKKFKMILNSEVEDTGLTSSTADKQTSTGTQTERCHVIKKAHHKSPNIQIH